MLAIVQRLVVPGFTGLKQKRITASAFGEGVEAHHETATDLCGVAERMRIHSHDPVGRVDSVIASSSAYVGITGKNRAMQHQHVLAEHEHFAVHRRRIRQPTSAGPFAAHRIGKVDGGVHLHLHFTWAFVSDGCDDACGRIVTDDGAVDALDVERWALGVGCFFSLQSARVSFRILDSFPDDQSRLRDASGRCISASHLRAAEPVLVLHLRAIGVNRAYLRGAVRHRVAVIARAG